LLKTFMTRFGRLAVRFIAVCGGLTAILVLVILGFESTGPFHAAVWHMRHGSTVSFDGHRFHLPFLWYPDANNHPGQFGLQRAQFGSIAFDHITLATVPRGLDNQAATGQIAAMTAHLNSGELTPSSRWTTEQLSGRALVFRCTMQTTDGAQETLICQAVDSNLRILALTMGRAAHTGALNIIETSE
jgi:hypothetical protein